MTTRAQLLSAATSLQDVAERVRGTAISYTVAGTVFAALDDDDERVRLWLPPADVEQLVDEHPTAEPHHRGGVAQGASIALADLDGQQLNRWVRQAWKHRAPASLSDTAAAAERAEPGHGGLPRAIGRPATRALVEAGIESLDDVARLSEAELAAMHGVGPTAIAILREAVAARG